MDDHAQHLRICPGNVKISANIHATNHDVVCRRDREHRLPGAGQLRQLPGRALLLRPPLSRRDSLRHDRRRLAHRGPPLPTREAARRSAPVLLVHGIAANRYNLDLTDETSLARHLCARGFDVCLVELRGRGFSLRPQALQRPALRLVVRRLRRARSAVRRRHRHARHRRRARSTWSASRPARWPATPGCPIRTGTVEVASLVSIGGAASFKRLGKRALGAPHPQLALLAPSLDPARAGAGVRLLAPVAAADHPQPREHRRRHPATDHGQHDRQLLAQRAAPVQRLDPATTSSARSISAATIAPSCRASPCRRCSWPGRATPCRRPTRSRTRTTPSARPTSSSSSARARRACASTTATSIW